MIFFGKDLESFLLEYTHMPKFGDATFCWVCESAKRLSPVGVTLVNQNGPKILFVSCNILAFPVINMPLEPPKITLTYRDRSEPSIYQTKR